MYELHRIGWNSFQQLCLTIAREILGQTVQSFLDSNDAGRDGALAGHWAPAPEQHICGNFVIQGKFSGKAGDLLSKSDIADELPKVSRLVAAGLCDVYVLMSNAGVSGKLEATIRSALIGAGAKHVLIYRRGRSYRPACLLEYLCKQQSIRYALFRPAADLTFDTSANTLVLDTIPETNVVFFHLRPHNLRLGR